MLTAVQISLNFLIPAHGQQGRGNSLCDQTLTFFSPLCFANFCAVPMEIVETKVPYSWGTPSTSKGMNRVSLTLFVGNPNFCIFYEQGAEPISIYWGIE